MFSSNAGIFKFLPCRDPFAGFGFGLTDSCAWSQYHTHCLLFLLSPLNLTAFGLNHSLVLTSSWLLSVITDPSQGPVCFMIVLFFTSFSTCDSRFHMAKHVIISFTFFLPWRSFSRAMLPVINLGLLHSSYYGTSYHCHSTWLFHWSTLSLILWIHVSIFLVWLLLCWLPPHRSFWRKF